MVSGSDGAVLFDPQSAERILRATLAVENDAGPPGQRRGFKSTSPVIQFVLITSDTPTSGLYPGKVQLYNAASDSWDDFGTIWAKAPNAGEVLLNAFRYPSRMAGPKPADSIPIFATLFGHKKVTVVSNVCLVASGS